MLHITRAERQFSTGLGIILCGPHESGERFSMWVYSLRTEQQQQPPTSHYAIRSAAHSNKSCPSGILNDLTEIEVCGRSVVPLSYSCRPSVDETPQLNPFPIISIKSKDLS